MYVDKRQPRFREGKGLFFKFRRLVGYLDKYWGVLRQSSANCMLRTLGMSTNDLIKINAFAAPAHI